MNKLRTSNRVIVILISLCLICYLFIFGKFLFPFRHFYGQILSYLILSFIIVLLIKFVFKLNIKEYLFKTNRKEQKSILKMIPFLFGLFIGIATNSMFIALSIGLSYGSQSMAGKSEYTYQEGLILACFLAPFFEELFFRGFFQYLIQLFFKNRSNQKEQFWYPIIVTSLAFSFFHLIYIFSLGAFQVIWIALLAFIIGLFTGVLRTKYNNILYCVRFHMGINISGLIYFPMLIFFGIIGSSEIKKLHKINTIYNFDLNNDVDFRKDLTNYFDNTFELNNIQKNSKIHCFIPYSIKCDNNGNITKIEYDTVYARINHYKFSKLGLEKSALLTLQSLKKFMPKKGMKKDTTIQYCVYIYNPSNNPNY